TSAACAGAPIADASNAAATMPNTLFMRPSQVMGTVLNVPLWPESLRSRPRRCQRASILWPAVTARCRRLDDDGFTGVDGRLVASLQPLHAAILAADPVLADLARLAAVEAERPHPAMAGQNRAFHSFEEADGPADAVPGMPSAFAARIFADVKILEHGRIAEFQHFRIGEAGVGHVRVNRIGAVEAGPGRRAGADRLVILIFRIAE